MFISVVIATRNRRALLRQTLAMLARQTWPRERFEIVVADNGSTDGTRELVETAATAAGAPRIRYVSVSEPGKSVAVNAAIAVAAGDLLAFTDDDTQPSPVWLERLAQAVADSGTDFVAGRIQPIWEEPPPEWLSPALYGVLAISDNGQERKAIARGVNEHLMPIGANMAVRASVVHRVGGLRADLGKLEGSLRTGEDHEFFLRLIHRGYRGVYEPEAVVAHLVPAARLQRRYFRSWLHQNGRDVASVESHFDLRLPRLGGIPRYLWRQAGTDLARLLAGAVARDEPRRVAAWLRLVWFAGYVRQSWFPERRAQAAPLTELA